MTALQWMIGILHVLLATQVVMSIYFFDDDEQERRPAIQHDFFKSTRETAGITRASIFTGPSAMDFGDDWCSFKVATSGDIVTATVEEDDCLPPSIRVVMAAQFPNSDFKDATHLFDDQGFNVKSIIANKAANSKKVTIKGEARQSINVFGYLNIGGYEEPTEFEFSWKSTEVMTLQNMELKMAGYAALGSKKAEIEIVKRQSKSLYEITKLDTGNARVQIFGDVAKKFTIYPPGIAREEDNVDYSKFGSMAWPEVKGYGAFNVREEFQIVLEHETKLSHTGAFGFAGITAKFVMSRFVNEDGSAQSPFGSFLIKMPTNKNIKEVVDPLQKHKNIRALPMLRRFNNRPWCMMISAKGGKFMDTDVIKEKMRFCFPDDGTEMKIKAGFNLKIEIQLRKTLHEDCQATAEQARQIPEVATLEAAITQQAVKFSFPPDYKTPLKATMKCMGADAFSDVPYHLFNEEGEEPILQIQEFSFTPANSELVESRMYFRVTFVFTIPQGYRTIPGTQLGLGPIKMHVQTNAKGPGWDIIGLTTIKAYGMELHVQLNHKKGADAWKLVLQVPSLTYLNIKQIFSEASPNTESESPFEQFGVKNFHLESFLNTSKIVQIRGNAILFGYKNIHVEGMYWRPKSPGRQYITNPNTAEKMVANQPEKAFAIGLWFKNIDLEAFLRFITGDTEKPSVSFFSNLNAIFVYSNAAGVVKGDGRYQNPEDSNIPYQRFQKRSFEDGKALLFQQNSESIHRPKRQKRENAPYSKRIAKKKINAVARSVGEESVLKRAGLPAEPQIEFIIPGLAATPIKKGVTIMLQYKLPSLTSKCFSNKICDWMVKNLGAGFHVQLLGYFQERGKVEITAKINADITIISPQVLIFNQLILRLRLGLDDPGIRIECQMTYNNPDLTPDSLGFMGAIEIGFTGKLVLEFGMSGIIPNPWGTDNFAFGNTFLSCGYSWGPVPLPSFQIGAQIMLGEEAICEENTKTKTSKTICIRGYVGINPNKLKDFWVYTKFNKLTVREICEAFNFNCSLPSAIENSGFPEGFTLSYASELKQIPAIGLSVPAGFFMSGRLNLFGIQLFGKIIIQKETMEIDVNMEPIKWAGGLIKFQRNETNEELGPICFIRASKTYFRVNIEGYSFILGITGAAKVEIVESKFEIYAKGSIFPFIFDAAVHLRATAGNLKTMSFLMSAEVETSTLLVKLRQGIMDFCKKLGADAKQVFDDANAKFDHARAEVTKTQENYTKWQEDIVIWNDRLEVKYNQLEAKRADLSGDCSTKCPKKCFGWFNWISECTEVWGVWIGCARWNSCYTKVNDVICLAGCTLSNYAKQFLVSIEQAFLKIDVAMNNVKSALGSMVEGVLSFAKTFLNFAQDVKTFVGEATVGAINALEWVVDHSNQVFWIDGMNLTASMDQQFDMCVSYAINCTVFTHHVNRTGRECLNNDFLKKLIYGLTGSEQLPDKYKGIPETQKAVEEAKGKLEEVEQIASTLKRNEDETQSKVLEETTKRLDNVRKRSTISRPDVNKILESLPKRTTVRTEKEMKYLIAATELIPEYNMKNEKIRSAFSSDTPWDVAETFKPVGLDAKVKFDPTARSVRSLIFESNMQPCERVRRALLNYGDLTNVLLRTTKNIREQNDAYAVHKQSHDGQLAELKSEIKAFESRHNLTDEERENAYFWYNKLDEGYNTLAERSEIALKQQDSYAMPILRRQLNDLLHHQNGASIDEFTDWMHKSAIHGYKRSIISTPSDVNVMKKLTLIKKDLVSIINNDDESLSDMSGKVKKVSKDIRSMLIYANKCKNYRR